jgi:surface antigen
MRVDRCGRLLAAFGLASLLAGLPVAEALANASSNVQRQTARQTATAPHPAASHGGLQCVPFARQVSGIDITGNAHTWWGQAEGRYQRGQTPEPGAVLVFRATGGMRLGHVSVVSGIKSPRHILVDHANWQGPGLPKGRVARNVSVIDVSPDNSWTLVRVEIHGDRDGFGRHYPTFGFVLPRTIDGAPPPALAPISTARATLDERAARAAAAPARYHGRATALLDIVAAEVSDMPAAAPRPGQLGPGIGVSVTPPAAPAQLAQAPATQPRPTRAEMAQFAAQSDAVVASLPAPTPVRVAQFTPRASLIDDDLALFAAPDRSLR